MRLMKLTAPLVVAFIVSGCVNQDRKFTTIADSEVPWSRSGFTIKPPSGVNWIKWPRNDAFPNSIVFSKGESASVPGAWVYVKGSMAVAMGVVFDEAIAPNREQHRVASDLGTYFTRYKDYWTTKITSSSYDSPFGYDCLKYSGTSKVIHHLNGAELKEDLKEQLIDGYLCVHPTARNFGVLMEARNIGTSWTDLTKKNPQFDHFFSSLTFTNVSTPVSRTFKTVSHHVGKNPSRLGFFRGALWVALQGENRLLKIRPADGSVIASIPVGDQPAGFTITGNSIWVANRGDGTVTRIDPDRAVVGDTIRTGGVPVALTSGNGFVWVADASGNAVIKIDPVRKAVTARIPVGRNPVAIIYGKDGVWTTNEGDGTVSVLDKERSVVIATVRVGGHPVDVTLADGSVWVADARESAVIRIDRVKKEVSSRIEMQGSPRWVTAFRGGDVFVTLAQGLMIVRIDPSQNRVFGPAIPAEGIPRSFVRFGDSIWFANSAGDTVTRLDLNPMGQALAPPAPSEKNDSQSTEVRSVPTILVSERESGK